jgi:hypothetical protein
MSSIGDWVAFLKDERYVENKQITISQQKHSWKLEHFRQGFGDIGSNHVDVSAVSKLE